MSERVVRAERAARADRATRSGHAAPSGHAMPDGHAVHLADVQRVLALFAHGLSGRYPAIASPATPGPGPAGATACAPGSLTAGRPGDVGVESDTLVLPEAMASFASARHNLGAYRIAVLHQLGYRESGTFAFPIARFVSQWPSPPLMQRLFVTLEDLRIDLALRRRYPGAAADLDRVLAHALRGRPSTADLPPVDALVEALVRHSLGATAEALLATDRSGMLAPLLDAAGRVHTEGAGVEDTAQAAAACYRVLERAGAGPSARAPTGDDAPASSGVDVQTAGHDGPPNGRGTSAPGEQAPGSVPLDFRGEFLAEAVRRLCAGARVGSLPTDPHRIPVRPPPDARDSRDRRADPHGRTDATTATRDLPDGESRSFWYDEWDYLRQAYVKRWCRLFERRLQGEDFGFLGELRRRHAATAQQVRRRFSVVKPASWQRVRRVADGEEPDLDAAIESRIDRRSGCATDEHLYTRRDRGQREVAAAFLLDMSASTGYPIAAPGAAVPAAAEPDRDDGPFLYGVSSDPIELGPSTPRRRVIDVARESLALMGQALQALGDGYALYGFSGEGRLKVEFHVAKDFDDRPSSRTWARLAAMQPQRSTRMGPAIRHAVTKLGRQSARLKVLVVVSDGYPQDEDYGPDRGDDEYGIQDTAMALQEAKRQGVQTLCVTIDPSGHDYLGRMCEPGRYRVIDDVSDLPEALTTLYRALTF